MIRLMVLNMRKVLAPYTASLTEMKHGGGKLLLDSEGATIAVLKNNTPFGYLVSTKVYEQLLDKLTDEEYVQIVGFQRGV